MTQKSHRRITPRTRLSGARLSNLREAIRKHPHATLIVRSLDELWSHEKEKLLEIALRLGINVAELLNNKEFDHQAEEEEWPFAGVIEFELDMTVFEKTVTRIVRLHYQHSPPWPYFDVNTKTEMLGNKSWHFRLEIKSKLDSWAWFSAEESDDGKAKRATSNWEQCNDLTAVGVWSDEIWDEIDRMIDEKCQIQDQANRRKFRI